MRTFISFDTTIKLQSSRCLETHLHNKTLRRYS